MGCAFRVSTGRRRTGLFLPIHPAPRRHVIAAQQFARAHRALARALESDLERGPIPFSRFMELALYHPEGGYYCQSEPRVGRRGDFYTSPHQSPWFGRMIASQTEIIWEAAGKPSKFLLIEYGPGEGWLARDLLEQVEAAGSPAFSEALEYIPVEISRSATKRLQDRLASGQLMLWQILLILMLHLLLT